MEKLKEHKKLIATIIVVIAAAFTAYAALTPGEGDDKAAAGINNAIEALGIDDMAASEE